MCEKLTDTPVPKKKGIFEFFGLKQEEEPLTCERCAYECMNGENSYKSLSERIERKQNEIVRTIKSKYAYYAQNGLLAKPAEFNCVVTIEEDIIRHVEEVFKPFIEGGFEIINISKVCEDIHQDNVYFISWYRAFQDVEKIVKL